MLNKLVYGFLLSYFLAFTQLAWAMSQAERSAFLNAIRPEAARLAGQPVKFKVSKINQEGNWALLMGELISTNNQALDWSKSLECNDDLDKMLWVIAKKEAIANKGSKHWKIAEIYICASEPPYWYLNDEANVAYNRPCGLYKGLSLPEPWPNTAQDQCIAYQAKHKVKSLK
jgi:hypothetical protein